MSYVLTLIDPTYGSSRVVAVFSTRELATNARRMLDDRMPVEYMERGAYYQITLFKTDYVY